MKRISAIAAGAVLASSLLAQPAQPPKTHLKVGDLAPDFTLPSSLGKPISLKDYRGKTVVVAFFPAAFTGG
jgi:cytochrome oxidase Cu insertion factor (SCO1/SenC/PrrC family)